MYRDVHYRASPHGALGQLALLTVQNVLVEHLEHSSVIVEVEVEAVVALVELFLMAAVVFVVHCCCRLAGSCWAGQVASPAVAVFA